MNNLIFTNNTYFTTRISAEEAIGLLPTYEQPELLIITTASGRFEVRRRTHSGTSPVSAREWAEMASR